MHGELACADASLFRRTDSTYSSLSTRLTRTHIRESLQKPLKGWLPVYKISSAISVSNAQKANN